MNDQTLVADLVDRGEPLAESPVDCYLEVDRDDHKAIIVWREPLAFHIEWNGARWSEHADSDGWLASSAELQFANRLTDYLRRAGVDDADVYTEGYNGEDEPTLTFEVVTPYRAGETFKSWFDRIGWPVVATLTNVTDPGTFMSPYLFDMTSL
jgi:hypothetical protein